MAPYNNNNQSKSYSQKLASFIKEVKFENLAEATVLKSKHSLLDWLGAVFAAYQNPLADKYIYNSLNESGDNLIIGSSEYTNISGAIFSNGALGHIAEVDDGHRASILHPGAVVMPAAISLGLKYNISGRKLLEAVVTGYELVIRVGECLGKEHYNIWHTTATAGTFGAAAAAAKVMGLDYEEIVSALGHAGTQAAGLWQFLLDDCASAKPLHPAKAALNGFISAEIAGSGIRGAEHIFEGDKGFCRAVSANYDLKKLESQLGKNYKIDSSNFKGYPTCGHTHSAIDALKKITAKHSFKAEEVESIKMDVYQKTIDVAGNPSPKNLESAKFSIYFCIGALLKKGDITFNNLSNSDLEDEMIKNIMERTEVNYDAELDKKFPASRPSRVKVKLKDGRSYTAENYFRRGDPENPMTEEEIVDKFNQLTYKIINKKQRDDIVERIFEIDKLDQLSDLEKLLCLTKED